jgi:hypothetical protein
VSRLHDGPTSNISKTLRPALAPTQPTVQWVRSPFPWVIRHGHSTPSTAEVKNEWRYTSTPRTCFHGVRRDYLYLQTLHEGHKKSQCSKTHFISPSSNRNISILMYRFESTFVNKQSVSLDLTVRYFQNAMYQSQSLGIGGAIVSC